MTNPRSIIEHYLLPEECEEFATWAFGEGFKDLIISDYPKAWNKRHKDLIEIHEDGNIEEDLWMMIDLWKNFKVIFSFVVQE